MVDMMVFMQSRRSTFGIVPDAFRTMLLPFFSTSVPVDPLGFEISNVKFPLPAKSYSQSPLSIFRVAHVPTSAHSVAGETVQSVREQPEASKSSVNSPEGM